MKAEFYLSILRLPGDIEMISSLSVRDGHSMPAVCWRVVDRSTSANCRGLGTSLPTRHRGKYSQILFWWVACCRAFWHIFFLSFYVCRTWALTESLLSPSSPYWWTPPKTLQRTCRLKKDWDPTYPMTFPTSCLPWSSLASATPRRTDSKCFYNYSHNSLTLSIYYYLLRAILLH